MHEYTLPLFLLFVASVATSYGTTAVVKRAAESVGAVDAPSERKLHITSTPRLGGLGIIFGFGFPLLLIAGNVHAAGLVSKNLTYLFAVLASGSLIVGLGVYDDLVGADAPKKFAVQTISAIILVTFGFHFTSVTVGGYTLDLGLLGLALSVLWVVGVINAVNFIDGMDSLATVVATTIALAFCVIAILRFDIFSLVIMTALSGSLVGFYPWNRPPAKIFMGDSGSLFIGLLLAACSMARPSKSPIALLISGPILALTLPVLDTLIVMKQRFGREPIPFLERMNRMFNADRRHIHHILIEKYGSEQSAIVSIWLVTLLFASAAIMTVMQDLSFYGYLLGAAGLLAMVFLRYGSRRRPAR